MTQLEIMEAGWRKAIRIAMGYPGVTKESKLVKNYAKLYNISAEELDILEQEAKIEAAKPRACFRCNGTGVARKCFDLLGLCECENAKRLGTIGHVSY